MVWVGGWVCVCGVGGGVGVGGGGGGGLPFGCWPMLPVLPGCMPAG